MLGAALTRMLFTLLHHLLSQRSAGPNSEEPEQLLRICAGSPQDGRALLEDALAFMDGMVEQHPAGHGNTWIVRKAKLYLDEHYSEVLSLKDVADVLGVSAGYLSKSFKAHGGDSFTEYLTEVRLEAAKRMMRETASSISDISYAVGFSDPGYFSKCFRKRENISPSEYAAMQRMIQRSE